MSLHLIELAVEPALREQFLVRPALDDGGVLDDEDDIRAADRIQVMCDDDARAPPHQTLERFRYRVL